MERAELQPIGVRKGLVAKENYTVYRPEGHKYKVSKDNPGQGQVSRSLPNSSTQERKSIEYL